MKELRAKDIVVASDGDVSFSVAGKWLKNENPSLAVKYAVKYFETKCSGVVAVDTGMNQPITKPAANPTPSVKYSQKQNTGHEGSPVGCRYYGNMVIDDLNATESYVEVGDKGYKVLRAWQNFSLSGALFARGDFKNKK